MERPFLGRSFFEMQLGTGQPILDNLRNIPKTINSKFIRKDFPYYIYFGIPKA